MYSISAIKKIKIFALVIILIASVLGVCGRGIHVSATTGEYRLWLQGDSRWANIELSSSGENMSQSGCAVTALAKLVVHSGACSEYTFDPGIFCKYLNNNGGFDSEGNIYWGAVSGLVPEFKYYSSVSFKGNTASEKTEELRNYINQGYYAVISVKNFAHWVAVDRIEGNNVYILDPAYNNRKVLFDYYNSDGLMNMKLFKTSGVKTYMKGMYITTNQLNIRSGMGIGYQKLGTIQELTQVPVLSISGNWGMVNYNGTRGWICLDYTGFAGEIYDLKGKYAVISDNGLYCRSGPGTSYTAYGLLPYGAIVIVNEISDGWGKISYNGKDAWIFMDYTEYVSPIQSNNRIIGDINNDGFTDNKDIDIISKYIENKTVLTDEEFARYDVYSDEVIDLKDAYVILRIIKGEDKG